MRQRQDARQRPPGGSRSQAGDRVLFGKYGGNEIKLEGEEYLILREDEILGIPDKSEKSDKERQEVGGTHG